MQNPQCLDKNEALNLVLAAAGIQFESPLVADLRQYLLVLGVLQLIENLGITSTLNSILINASLMPVKHETFTKVEQQATNVEQSA